MESLCADRGRGNPHPHRPHHHMGLGGRSSNTGCKIAYCSALKESLQEETRPPLRSA